MTTAAWMMLAATWAVVCFFTGKFFLKVVRTPLVREDGMVEGAADVDDVSEHD
ncbi:MAG TPA: hypothetical protein VMS56_09670 [Thermoanaerobaculia bacterium]|nr:hypothetical protein [Thermoanaerobaculia bacterium]